MVLALAPLPARAATLGPLPGGSAVETFRLGGPIKIPAGTGRTVSWPVLLPGGRGPAVAQLWHMLYTLHYIDQPTKAPARYGTALALGVRRFEWLNALPVDPVIDADVWEALSVSVAEHVTISPAAAEWRIVVRESRHETASVYYKGKLVVSTPANTGVWEVPTPLGVYFVYEKLAYQVMKGKNPNGTKYADPVRDIWYFVGGDAFHGFVRAAYGFPQSAGCVEVPPAVAASLFPRVPLGAEVDVVP